MKIAISFQKGLTLIEALLAAAAIAVLVFIFLWDGGTESAKIATCQT